MTIGATAAVDPESLVHSRYILIWACNMISTNLHLWPFVAEAQRRGAKVVVIDPVRHRTAAHADWYIPIRPGTDGALALAMMNVIIGEGLTDEAYIRDYTVGYGELAERVARYTPEWASEKTGSPPRTSRPGPGVRRGPALDDPHRGGHRAARRGRATTVTLYRLPAAWSVRGWRVAAGCWSSAAGVPGDWPALPAPGAGHAGDPGGQPVPAGPGLDWGSWAWTRRSTALMVYNSNPVVVCRNRGKVVAGLSRGMGSVHRGQVHHFLTETARYADLVLRDHQLEQHRHHVQWRPFRTLNARTPPQSSWSARLISRPRRRRLAAGWSSPRSCFDPHR